MKIEKLLSPKKLLIPIAIGLGVIGYLFYSNFDKEAITNMQFGWESFFWLVIILLLVAIRQLAYMFRIRILSNNQLNFRQSFEVISLWELASAISPSAVGGSAVAMFILNKEGIKLGKSTTIAITTLFLDLLIFVTLSLTCYFILGSETFLGHSAACKSDTSVVSTFFSNLNTIFWVVITGISIFLVVLYYGVFIHSKNLKRFIFWIFSAPFLKNWKHNAKQMTDDIDMTAKELRRKNFFFWFQAIVATAITWSARFLLVNPVLAAFTNLNASDHFIIYARNFVLWLVMLIPTTPGASGVSEATLGELICEFVPNPGLSPVILFIWRFFDYLIYFGIGAFVIPRWLSRTVANKKAHKAKKN